jgi:hypothetical protein
MFMYMKCSHTWYIKVTHSISHAKYMDYKRLYWLQSPRTLRVSDRSCTISCPLAGNTWKIKPPTNGGRYEIYVYIQRHERLSPSSGRFISSGKTLIVHWTWCLTGLQTDLAGNRTPNVYDVANPNAAWRRCFLKRTDVWSWQRIKRNLMNWNFWNEMLCCWGSSSRSLERS